MILKIRKNHLYTNDGWYVISGVSDISYSGTMAGITTSEELSSSWFKEVYHDGEEIEEGNEERKVGKRRYFSPSDKSGRWIRIIVGFVGRINEEWIVQAETYLLNDEGKTIERIF